MAAFLKLTFSVLIFYSSVHFVHSHPTPSAKHGGMSFKFSHVQPTKEATEDPVNSTRNRNHHNLNSLRKLELKEQQIPSDRIKRNATESMKDELVSSTRRANGSATDVRGRNYLNRSSVRSRVSWQSFRGRRQVTHSCVKRIVKTYHAALDEIVTEYECWKSSFYCNQTSSGLYRCEPVMTFHAGLDKTLTVGCRYFDRGLHGWMTRYIYIPMGGSRKGLIRQLTGSFLSFAFIWQWHGGHLYALWWFIPNWLGVVVESAAGKVLAHPSVRRMEEKLSPAASRRIRAIFGIVSLTCLILSNLVFLCGSDPVWFYVKRIFVFGWPSSALLLLFSMYMIVQTNMELNRHISQW